MNVAMPKSGRPVGGGSSVGPAVPSASLPLSFIFAAGTALIAFGCALFAAAGTFTSTPTAARSIATVHLGLLACLTTAVLGATHQFGPVVGGLSMRSERAGYITLALFFPAALLLPYSFAMGHPVLLELAGITATCAVLLAAWNLSRPLLRRGRGTSVAGLRLAIGYLVVTACFGATYAFDIHHGWFLLYPPRVLAHAHLGLLGWLGLAYLSVAEKLWPMFLLAHPRWTDPGMWAVRLMAVGVAVFVTGLLLGSPLVVGPGVALIVAAAIAHLLSLASVIRNRRRAMEILHAFVLVSAAFLVSAIAHGLVATIAPVSPELRERLVAVEVGSVAMWILLAVLGHVHKIVPFIVWGQLRKRGITKTPEGKPLLFAHLFNLPLAKVTLVAATTAAICLLTGLARQSATPAKAAGILFALVGIMAMVNLVSGPLLVIRNHNAHLVETTAKSEAMPSPAQ